jgi:hypothetical protein
MTSSSGRGGITSRQQNLEAMIYLLQKTYDAKNRYLTEASSVDACYRGGIEGKEGSYHSIGGYLRDHHHPGL